MAGQLIPPPELAPPPLPRDMPPPERFLAWLDMLASGEKLLISGMQREAEASGDGQQDLQRWYEMTADDRLQHRIRRARELALRSEESDAT